MSKPVQLEAQTVAARRLSNFLASNGAALDLEDAIAIARGAVALAPVSESHNALAGVLNDVPGAEELQAAAADAAIADDAENWAAWHNKSLALLRLHRGQEAAQAISTALRLLPAKEANPYLAMQAAFVAGIRGEHEDALGYLADALAVVARMDTADPRATVLAETVRHECCIARFVAYAHMGNWAEAFGELANRFRTSPARNLVTQAEKAGRTWKPGSTPAFKTVIVVLEWGLGDQIQFARFVPELAHRGIFENIVVACSTPLFSLMGSLNGVSRVMDRDALTQADLDDAELVPVLDLMADYWARTGDPVGGNLGGGRGNGYLKAPGKAKPELPQGKPVLAFAWQGDPRQTHDWNRRLPLASLGAWAGANRELFNFASLQTRFAGYGEPWADWPDDVPVVDASQSVMITDLGELADWIEAADVFVGQCGGLVHLAGALGKPAVVMLAASHDWRWDQSPPLYASVLRAVQTAPGDWASAFSKLTYIISNFGIIPPPVPVEEPTRSLMAEVPASAGPVDSGDSAGNLAGCIEGGRRPSPRPPLAEPEPNFAYLGDEETAAYHARRASAPASILEQPADSAAISNEGETQQ